MEHHDRLRRTVVVEPDPLVVSPATAGPPLLPEVVGGAAAERFQLWDFLKHPREVSGDPMSGGSGMEQEAAPPPAGFLMPIQEARTGLKRLLHAGCGQLPSRAVWLSSRVPGAEEELGESVDLPSSQKAQPPKQNRRG